MNKFKAENNILRNLGTFLNIFSLLLLLLLFNKLIITLVQTKFIFTIAHKKVMIV